MRESESERIRLRRPERIEGPAEPLGSEAGTPIPNPDSELLLLRHLDLDRLPTPEATRIVEEEEEGVLERLPRDGGAYRSIGAAALDRGSRGKRVLAGHLLDHGGKILPCRGALRHLPGKKGQVAERIPRIFPDTALFPAVKTGLERLNDRVAEIPR